MQISRHNTERSRDPSYVSAFINREIPLAYTGIFLALTASVEQVVHDPEQEVTIRY